MNRDEMIALYARLKTAEHALESAMRYAGPYAASVDMALSTVQGTMNAMLQIDKDLPR